MPHFCLEYSAPLENTLDLEALCQVVHSAAVEAGIFPLGGIRVRAVRSEHFAVADLHPDNRFLHISARIGAGRSDEAQRAAGDLIYNAVEAAVASELAKPHFSLSMEMRVMVPSQSWKTNSIHPRLAGHAE